MMNGFSTGEEDSQGPIDQTCCLVDNGRRCSEPAGNASYNKRIEKTVIHRKLQLTIANSVKHMYICDKHKMIIQSARTKRRRKDSEDDSNETDTDVPEVDLYQLQVNTLRRYKKHYKVSTRPGLNKAQLADQLMKHFKQIPVKEKDVLTFFIYTVKTHSNKLDQKNDISGDNT
ncbi:putative histone deacetylase complex subunit SAP30 homolog [Trypoxylus dichotomus]